MNNRKILTISRVMAILRCVYWLLHYKVLYRLMPLPRLLEAARSPDRKTKGTAEVAHSALSVNETYRIFCGLCRRSPLDLSCLVQALALRRVFQAAGIDACIRFGIQEKTSAVLRAHAWIEVSGTQYGIKGGLTQFVGG